MPHINARYQEGYPTSASDLAILIRPSWPCIGTKKTPFPLQSPHKVHGPVGVLCTIPVAQ